MQIARTLSSPARVALYGGIGNETPWGVEADELFRKPVKKNTVTTVKAVAVDSLLREESEPVVQTDEPPVSITD